MTRINALRKTLGKTLGKALGLAAILLTAAACSTTPPCLESDNQLGSIESALRGKASRADYYNAVTASYAELGEIGAFAAGETAEEPADTLMCRTTAARAAMAQASLPVAQRPASDAPPPALAAGAAALEGVSLCGTVTDALRCPVVRSINGVALSQDTAEKISALAADPASTPTVAAWEEANALIRTFGEASDSWSVPDLPTANATPDETQAHSIARGYTDPLACTVFVDGGRLRSRPASADAETAATDYATSYLASMSDIADVLGLSTSPAAAAACETDPNGVGCLEAPAEAVRAMCASFWGQGG